MNQPTCEDCGGPARVWFAPNRLWNLVKGGPDATDDPGGILCPNCFIDRAETAGVKPTAWVIDRETFPASESQAALHYLRQLPAGREVFVRDVPVTNRKVAFNALAYATRCGDLERLAYGRYRRAALSPEQP